MILLRTLFVILAVIGLVSCATSVKVDYDENTDFNTLKTFALLPPDKPKTDDIRITSPLLATRISNALTNTLGSLGYEQIDKAPDFYVTYHLRIKQEVESRSSGSASVGVGSYGSHSAIGMGYGYPAYEVYSYERGILTVDVLDSKKTLIWRGSTSRILTDEKSPRESDKVVNAVVAQILEKFPPGVDKTAK